MRKIFGVLIAVLLIVVPFVLVPTLINEMPVQQMITFRKIIGWGGIVLFVVVIIILAATSKSEN